MEILTNALLSSGHPYRFIGVKLLEKTDGYSAWVVSLEELYTPSHKYPQAFFNKVGESRLYQGTTFEAGVTNFGPPLLAPVPFQEGDSVMIQDGNGEQFLGPVFSIGNTIETTHPTLRQFSGGIIMYRMYDGLVLPEAAFESQDSDLESWRSVSTSLTGHRRSSIFGSERSSLTLELPITSNSFITELVTYIQAFQSQPSFVFTDAGLSVQEATILSHSIDAHHDGISNSIRAKLNVFKSPNFAHFSE